MIRSGARSGGAQAVGRVAPLLVVASLALAAPGRASDEALIPLEHFFASPRLEQLRLSPDGRHLAAIIPDDETPGIAVVDTETRETVAPLGISGRQIVGFRWANDERLLVSARVNSGMGFQTRMIAINLDGSGYKDFARRERTAARAQYEDQLVHVLPRDPEHVLIAYPEHSTTTGRLEGMEVYRLDIYTGSMRRVPMGLRGGAFGWWADSEGVIRMARQQRGATASFFHRRDADSPWTPIEVASDVLDFVTRYQPLALGPDPEIVYMAARPDDDRFALYPYDVEKQELGRRIFSHPDVDVPDQLVRDREGRLLGVRFSVDYPRTEWFDRELEALARRVDARFPGLRNDLIDWSEDRKQVLVDSYSDAHPHTYYLFQPEKDRYLRISSSHPDLDPERLVHRKRFRYAARDGTPLWGYVALPKGRAPQDLPLIVNPHGGPWARDRLGFAPEIQFLASRGWAVFQPNFRGSSGFGLEFLMQGYQQWGLRMQEDITDGVRSLIEAGIADPERICIYGWSYGGYAAASGLVSTPDLYRCGASAAGVSDLPRLLKDSEWFLFVGEAYEELIGDQREHRDRLEATSPLRNVARIRAPVFIAHGDEDRRVRVDHSRELHEALTGAGKQVEYFEMEDEVHGLSLEHNRLEFYRRLERFLTEHLAPRQAADANLETRAQADP